MEGPGAPLVSKANPEDVVRAPEHHAVGKSLLEPWGGREGTIGKQGFLTFLAATTEPACTCVAMHLLVMVTSAAP